MSSAPRPAAGRLLSDGAAADDRHREAIERLGRTRLRPELARAHLLYGEWCVVKVAASMRGSIFARPTGSSSRSGWRRSRSERGWELLATGEKVRRRRTETRDELTAQEWQIAQLAREGLSNREIGARLFLSHRTVESHLSTVYSKLGIRTRGELAKTLSVEPSV